MKGEPRALEIESTALVIMDVQNSFGSSPPYSFRELGQPEAADRFAAGSVDMNPGYARGRVFNLSLLASVCVQLGEVERAAALGIDATEMAASMRSARTRDYLTALGGELAPFAGNPQVDDFLDRTAGLTPVGPGNG